MPSRLFAIPVCRSSYDSCVWVSGDHDPPPNQWSTGNRVFQYDGAHVDDCNTAAFQKAVKRAQLRPLRWHDLRHTFASWAVQSGVTLHELMQLGDWKSYSMVLRYGHLAPDQLSKAAELVAQKGHTARRGKAAKRAQGTDFTCGERGTRTLDLGIMSAEIGR